MKTNSHQPCSISDSFTETLCGNVRSSGLSVQIRRVLGLAMTTAVMGSFQLAFPLSNLHKGGTPMNRRISTVLPTSAFLLSAAILFSSSVAYAQSAVLQESQSTNLSHFTNLHNNFDPYTPIFTPFRIKEALTDDPGFTNLLLSNAQRYIPWIMYQNVQAHLGFWSGPGNRGNLVRLLGDINNAPPPPGGHRCTQGPSTDCAIWDEGAVESEQLCMSRC